MPGEIEIGNRADVPAREVRPTAFSRVLAKGDHLTVSDYIVPRGFTVGGGAEADIEKAGYVVSGRFQITTDDGREYVIEAGGAYTIPRGVAHRFTVLEDAVIVQVNLRLA
jgi:quercetin dioxygenase-like cupin family protein